MPRPSRRVPFRCWCWLLLACSTAWPVLAARADVLPLDGATFDVRDATDTDDGLEGDAASDAVDGLDGDAASDAVDGLDGDATSVTTDGLDGDGSSAPVEAGTSVAPADVIRRAPVVATDCSFRSGPLGRSPDGRAFPALLLGAWLLLRRHLRAAHPQAAAPRHRGPRTTACAPRKSQAPRTVDRHQ